jgi:hypothetical protein
MCGWPPTCKSFLVMSSGRLQSCVRPFCAVMTAGLDGFRGSRPYQLVGIVTPPRRSGFSRSIG